MSKGKKNLIFIVASAVVVVIAIILIIAFVGKGKSEKVKIGFVMSGSIKETGWNGMHYEGIKNACDKMDVELLIKENVKEFSGECKESIRELAKDGAKMIILSSYGYSEEVKDLIKEYPDIVFNVNSSEFHDKNMTSYFVRMYQARYLAGVVAGLKTENNKIGYVAAMANNEVNRGINAFTLGVKRVNPDAEVIVNWTGAWDDENKEKEAAKELINKENVDLLTYHQNQPNVVEAAEAAGVYSIGYHIAMDNTSSNNLTAVVCEWQLVYEELIRTFLIGKGNEVDNYWIGMEVDAVELAEYSDEVSDMIKSEVEEAKEEILSGKDVFSRIIYDNEGKLRCDDKETISDEMLLENFDWYVEGVRIYER